MPIKLPKGFQRRKSSGNALEENPNPPQPTFRVFERSPDGSKSFDGGGALKRFAENRPRSDGQYREFEQGKLGLNRGSGGTQNSASTGRLYDTSSSARFSSSSTLPSSSSFDAAHDDLSHAHPKPPQKAAAPSGFSLRAAGRTFSFGARKSIQPTPPSPSEIPLPQQHSNYTDVPDIHQGMRQRAMTETSYASGSTATPPKLLDTDFGNNDGDGFGDIFAGLGNDKRRSRATAQGFQAYNPQGNWNQTAPPPPIQTRTSERISPAPYSSNSQTSRDELMTSSPQGYGHSFQNQPSPTYDTRLKYTSSPNMSDSQELRVPQKAHSNTQPIYSSHGRPPSTLYDEDTRLAMQYIDQVEAPGQLRNKRSESPVKKRNYPEPPPPPRHVTLFDGANQDHSSSELSRSDSITTTPKAKQATLSKENNGLIDDLDFQEMAISADKFQTRDESPPPRRPPPPKTQGKVMTPAQFERYRKEQESLRNQYANKSDSEDEDGDGDKYEDDDEEERNKEMARQRRRQDAQMSVYRQQMMKVTGEQQPLNAGSQRLGAAGMNDRSMGSKSSEDDEDEDIPLGILAAHGFPSKERPPSHLNRMGSQPNIRYTSETYPAPPASMSGVSVRESGNGNVPAFARNLPKDPFYGASLVNPAERQSLAFGSGSQATAGGSQVGAPNPGGLVGVIAKEERARAMRRGSPNTAGFEMPGPMPPLQNMHGTSPSMGADQQAQMQMSQQMTQMMQMQMQWMQQMMHMQGMQGQMPPMPGIPGGQIPQMPLNPMMQGSPLMDPNAPRPNSMGSMTTGQRPQASSRSMSMLSPDPQAWNARNSRGSTAPSLMVPSGRSSGLSQASGMGPHSGFRQSPGYAASLAPSERSNVGLASRYRPVSTMPAADGGGRTSTMGSSTLRQWDGQGKGKASATLRVVPGKTRNEDEDEDEGWEEMRKKREKKRTLWRGKKADRSDENTLDGVFYPPNLD